MTYLRYLRAEGELYRGWFDDDEVRAVYFGGGTANLFAPGPEGILVPAGPSTPGSDV